MKLAFIPARGGSKRLPGKNIRLLGKRPLISYSIAYAQYCGFEKIVVSTDSDLVADAAAKDGAEILMRPEEISGDLSTTSIAAKHCLEHYNNQGCQVDVFVTLQPTNPLRPEDLFRNAFKKYNESTCDSVISVSLNRHKLGRLENTCFKPQNYEPEMRSQDMKPLFYENGLIYLSRPEMVLQNELFGNAVESIVTDELFGMADIDTLFDFELAEYLYSKYSQLFKYLGI